MSVGASAADRVLSHELEQQDDEASDEGEGEGESELQESPQRLAPADGRVTPPRSLYRSERLHDEPPRPLRRSAARITMLMDLFTAMVRLSAIAAMSAELRQAGRRGREIVMEMKTETTKSKTTMSKRTMSSNRSPIKSPNRGLVRDLQGAKSVASEQHSCPALRGHEDDGPGPLCIAMAPLGTHTKTE